MERRKRPVKIFRNTSQLMQIYLPYILGKSWVVTCFAAAPFLPPFFPLPAALAAAAAAACAAAASLSGSRLSQ